MREVTRVSGTKTWRITIHPTPSADKVALHVSSGNISENKSINMHDNSLYKYISGLILALLIYIFNTYFKNIYKSIGGLRNYNNNLDSYSATYV